MLHFPLNTWGATSMPNNKRFLNKNLIWRNQFIELFVELLAQQSETFDENGAAKRLIQYVHIWMQRKLSLIRETCRADFRCLELSFWEGLLHLGFMRISLVHKKSLDWVRQFFFDINFYKALNHLQEKPASIFFHLFGDTGAKLFLLLQRSRLHSPYKLVKPQVCRAYGIFWKVSFQGLSVLWNPEYTHLSPTLYTNVATLRMKRFELAA